MNMKARAVDAGAPEAAPGTMALARGIAALAGRTARRLWGARGAGRAGARSDQGHESPSARARGAPHLRATFGLVLLALALLSAPDAEAQTETELWSATLTVGTTTSGSNTFYGYAGTETGDFGSLSDTDFTYRTATILVATLAYLDGGTLRLSIDLKLGTRPADGLLGDDDFRLEIGTGDDKKTFDIDSPGTTTFFQFSDHGLSWSVNDTIAVRLVKIENSAATGKPTISGTPRVAEPLTVSTSGIADENGLDTATFEFQWIRVDGMDEEDIDGATGRTYRPVPADKDKKLKVKVSFTDDDGYAESRTSDASGTVGAAVVEAATCTGTREVWSSTLTLGKRIHSGITSLGYLAFLGTGSLADTTFTENSTQYRVSGITVRTAGALQGTLFLTLQAGGTDFDRNYLLCLGGDTFNFGDASFSTATFSWAMSGLDWSEGAKIGVKIVYLDTTAPMLESAEVSEDGRNIILDFDEDLDGSNLPPLTAFSVTADGRQIAVGNPRLNSGDASKFELSTAGIENQIYAGETVVVTYEDPTAGDDTKALQDATGNDTGDFTTGQDGVPAATNNSTAQTAGDVSISVEQDSVTEGNPQSPGDRTLTWTLTARTDTDREPEPSLEFEMLVSTNSGSAESPDDYEALNETVRFEGTDTWVRTEVEEGTFRYITTKSGTVTIKDDAVVEGDETFEVIVESTANSGEFILGTRAAAVTIVDRDPLTGLRVSLERRYILETDDPGTSEDERRTTATFGLSGDEAIDGEATVTVTLGGSATLGTDYTVSPGDTDTVATGHQVAWPASTRSVEMILRALADSTPDEVENISVSASITAHGRTFNFARSQLRLFETADDVQFRGPVSEGFPPRPGSIIALPDGPHAIKIFWSAPIDGPRGVASYWLEVSDNGGVSWNDLVIDTGPVTPIGRTDFEHRDAPVQAGVTRWYRVSSLNAKGASEPMTVNEGTTATGTPVSGCTRQHAVWCADVTFRGSGNIYRRTRPPPITIDGKQYHSSYLQIHQPGATVAWAFIGRKVDATLRNMVLWIDDLELPFADAQLTPGETMAYWEIEGGVTLVDSAHFELVDSRGDIHAPEPERAYVFGSGLEVLLELSEPLGRSAGALPASIVDDFTVGFEGSERKVEFSSAVLSSAQDAEDATGNHHVLKALDRHEVRAIRLVLDAANRIERDEFVYLSYDGEALADAAGNALEAFDIQRIVNASDWRDGVKLAERATEFGSPNIFRLSIDRTPGIRSERSTEFSNLRSLRTPRRGGGKNGITLMSADGPTVIVEADTDAEWGPGDQVVVKVQYSRPVRVDTTGGTPSISLRVGETPLTATYTRGSGTDTLVFTATVPSDAPASNTVSVSANALSLNGAVIVSAQGQNAEIEHVAVERVLESEPEGIVATVKKVPDSHDGSAAFKVEIGFSERITTNYSDLDDAFDVDEGSIEAVRRVDGKSDHWELTVRPTGTEDVVITLEGGQDCALAHAPCTSDDVTVGQTLQVTVPGPEDASDAALTVWVDKAPKEHDGTNFDVRVKFSQEIVNGYAYVAQATRVQNGTLRRARRHEGRHDMWVFEVDPQSAGRGVVLVLKGGGTCAGSKSPVICTREGKVLSHTLVTQVKAQAQVSVADARAEEGVDETIDFRVFLDRPAYTTVTVEYETSDLDASENGRALAGLDYTAKSGTVTFEEGEITQIIPVTVLDDAIDEGEERFKLTLSSPVGIRIADATAIGTIENDDPLQKAILARLGRTIGGMAVDAVTGRLDGAPASEVSIAGRSLTGGGDATTLAESEADARAQAMQKWLRGEEEDLDESTEMSGRDVLLQSHFLFTGGGQDGAPRYGAWGRFAAGSFEGEEDAVTLSGEVTSGFLGADIEAGRWLGGLAIGISEGDGSWGLTSSATSTRRNGTFESTLTAAYPYVRLRASEQLSFWGMGGFGAGTMTITQEDDPGIESDISMRMGALGVKGTVLEAPPEGGLAVNVKSDVMHVRMESEAVTSSIGNMEGAEADVTRYRLILEGSRAYALAGEATLTPSIEVGLRHDAGDAETGTGVELGGRIAYQRAGVALEAAGRMLAAHEDSGYEEWGASASVRIDPGESGRGLSLTVTPAVGNTGSMKDSLWGANDAGMLARDEEFKAGRRIETELGYGLRAPVGVVTPFAGLGLADESRTLRLGTRWTLGPATSMHLEGVRSESAGEDAEHRVGLTFSASF